MDVYGVSLNPEIRLGWPLGLWMGLALATLILAVVLVRRPALPRSTAAGLIVGLGLLSMAAGLPLWDRPLRQPVMVMVDLSPSTRAADYRDPTVLRRRIADLLDGTRYRLEFFADGVAPVTLTDERLADVPAEKTRYTPPVAPAILLFSDCRFALPLKSSPTYVVVDPALEDPEDASISDVEVDGSEVAARIRNSGSERRLTFNGRLPTTAPSGSLVVRRALPAGASAISAELSPGDAWPENDALDISVPPGSRLEQWWIGGQAAPPGEQWRVLTPAQLPLDAASYLDCRVIVLDDISASELSVDQQRRLEQYVRDLGGGLLILGGERAFAAGGYQGTPLDSISPLASSPPSPTLHWVLLCDSSGSMSSPAADSTRWRLILDAIRQLPAQLPPDDLLSVGSFADKLHWWMQGQSVRDARSAALPPADLSPHGPTNLQPALEAIAHSADGSMPIQLLVLSDFDTQITEPDRLAALLKSKRIRLHLLAIGQGTALPALEEISRSTQGIVLRELDARRWAAATRKLAQAAMPQTLQSNPVTVTFEADAGPIRPYRASPWNRTWVKASARKLADASLDSQSVPMAAQWNVGEGRVIAATFEAQANVAQRLADRVASSPHDPRFSVTWQTGRTIHVTVDAISGKTYLNGQRLSLELAGSGGVSRQSFQQTGPGRYEISAPSPRSATVATVRAEGRAIARDALAGRYAPEFDAVGNDHAAMQELARRSGGEVVRPGRTTPLDIHWPRRPVSLVSPLATAGALFIALGLIWWRVQS